MQIDIATERAIKRMITDFNEIMRLSDEVENTIAYERNDARLRLDKRVLDIKKRWIKNLKK